MLTLDAFWWEKGTCQCFIIFVWTIVYPTRSVACTTYIFYNIFLSIILSPLAWNNFDSVTSDYLPLMVRRVDLANTAKPSVYLCTSRKCSKMPDKWRQCSSALNSYKRTKRTQGDVNRDSKEAVSICFVRYVQLWGSYSVTWTKVNVWEIPMF